MYFAVLGKTPDLSLLELERLGAEDMRKKGAYIFFRMGAHAEDMLTRAAGIIKRGKTIHEDDIPDLCTGKLLGTNSRKLGMQMKKAGVIRRFKEMEPVKSDLDVKQSGVEILDLGADIRGHVQGRQYIDRFACIDFDKPSRGMQIGMMPAKLTQLLVNIGVSYSKKQENVTVYDPFCGFGTTLWVANTLGYNAIGSDINASLAKKNLTRWKETEHADADARLMLYKHDVLEPFTKGFLDHVDVIITEGWLGPVVRQQMKYTNAKLINANIDEVVRIYRGFIGHTWERFPQVPIIMTVPVYDRLGPVIQQRITLHAEHIGYSVEALGETYQRKKQLVGRQVLVLRKAE